MPGCEIGAKVTVVDAGRCRMYIRNFGEFFNDQVHNADVIVLSRTDSAADGKVKLDLHVIVEQGDRDAQPAQPQCDRHHHSLVGA